MSRNLTLGIDVGGTAMKLVLADADGAVVHRDEVPTRPHDLVGSLADVAAAMAGPLGGAGHPRLLAVGLACAGIVDPVAGTLGRSPNLPGWEDSSLADALRAAFGEVPGACANDVNAALWGEARHGAGRDCAGLVMIALGTGVGGGVMVGGELVIGAHCGAGEIGHTVLDPDGDPCTCGGRGCLEAYAGSVGLLRHVRETATGTLAELVARRGDDLTTADVASLAEAGDADARAVFTRAGRRLGQAVGNLVNILDPDRVIIGGGVARAGDLILAPCREIAPRLVLAAEAKNLPIVAAELGHLAAARGAAALARDLGAGG